MKYSKYYLLLWALSFFSYLSLAILKTIFKEFEYNDWLIAILLSYLVAGEIQIRTLQEENNELQGKKRNS